MLMFEIKATDGKARCGLIHTARGAIRTPAFMPVGTQGTVKALELDKVRFRSGRPDGAPMSDIILGNTYHLMLRPTAERMQKLGGLHAFCGWEHPILTDSGGFQVMSLGKLCKIRKEGVYFQSHLDGSSHFLSPERAIDIQMMLGSNIQMVLDQCVALPATPKKIKSAVYTSLAWAQRSKIHFDQDNKARQPLLHSLFAIVQGGLDLDLRSFCAGELIAMGFDGYAVGGLAVGETHEEMVRVLEHTVPLLPHQKPRYLMGVGTPWNMLEAVASGIDMFDCVLPTRLARHGVAYTSQGRLNLRNSKYAQDLTPLDQGSTCPAAQYSKAYVHHLVRAKEILGAIVLSQNNISFYQDFMQRMRDAIASGTFAAFRAREAALWSLDCK